MCRQPSPRAGASFAARLAVLMTCLTALLGATGCATWKPIQQMGVPGTDLDEQLEGNVIRYPTRDGYVETKILTARTPYVEIPGPRDAPKDPQTGERPRDVIDLRLLHRPKVKIPDRPATIFVIAGGSALGAGVVSLLIYGLVSGLRDLGSTHITYYAGGP